MFLLINVAFVNTLVADVI